MWKTAHQHILKLVSYEPGKPVEELAREMGLQPDEIVKLASNENPLGPSPKAVAAMRDALNRSHFYPDGGGWALRSAIARNWNSSAKTSSWAMGRTKSSNSSGMPFFGLVTR